jgi:hypothetical protein
MKIQLLHVTQWESAEARQKAVQVDSLPHEFPVAENPVSRDVDSPRTFLHPND